MLSIENAAGRAGEFLASVAPYPSERFAGRGIVTCAGGVKYLTCAWVLIKMLRHVGCTLPIELWYLGEDEGDENWIKLVEPLGVKCIDAFEVAETDPHPHLGGWESKSYAILHSRFEEVVFLDADNVPVVDPAVLFDTPEYRQTGALFWPDLGDTPASSPRWQIFGVPYRDEPDQETGQLVIDKRRGWRALNLADWYNRNSVFYYQHVYGDTNTFRFAWHALGQAFSMPRQRPDAVPRGMWQHDFQGRRLLQHCVGRKWSLLESDMAGGEFPLDICGDALRELRNRWQPVEWLARRARRPGAGDPVNVRGRRFRFALLGQDHRRVVLGENGFVSPTVGEAEMLWWQDDTNIVMADAAGIQSWLFRLQSDGEWLGRATFDDVPWPVARLVPDGAN